VASSILSALMFRSMAHRTGRTFRFALDGSPALLGTTVQWACWDSVGGLLVAREGTLERFTLDDIRQGHPSFRLSLDQLDHHDQTPDPSLARTSPAGSSGFGR
jgi:hypothetical protein